MPPIISAIVPAYNESQTITPVLEVLTSFPGFGEVIVVADGSTDDTVAVVRKFPVKYLEEPSNQGKGAAMDRGVSAASGDIIFFCDADLRGLTHEAIRAIISPVVRGEATMCVAVRGRSVSWLTRALAHLFPLSTLIAGERSLTRELWQALPAKYKQGFRIEFGLNYLAAYQSPGLAYIVVPELRQTIKEKKYGLKQGLRRRIAMLGQMLLTITWLAFDRRLRIKALK